MQGASVWRSADYPPHVHPPRPTRNDTLGGGIVAK